MIHKGLSGHAIERRGDFVVKWTQGETAHRDLYNSWFKNNECHRNHSLFPIKTIKQSARLFPDDLRIEVTMPFIEGESGLTTTDHLLLKDHVKSSFYRRSKEIRNSGFKEICNKQLSSLNSYNIKEADELEFYLRSYIDRCEDSYIYGFCHGDFGFANLIVTAKDVFAIDLTPSFIDSPLMDIATMELCLFDPGTKPFHFHLFESLEKEYFRFKAQKDVLRMIKVLSFFREGQSLERTQELIRMFYGRSNRIADI